MFGDLTIELLWICSVMSSVVDRDGLRHVLLCRVILGRTEEVVRGSGQSQPGSVDFDSGVDDMKFPTRYVVWYPEVNSRVLPLYVLSIKVDFRSRGQFFLFTYISFFLPFYNYCILVLRNLFCGMQQ